MKKGSIFELNGCPWLGRALQDVVATIFGKSPVVLATIIAVILNVILPRSSKNK